MGIFGFKKNSEKQEPIYRYDRDIHQTRAKSIDLFSDMDLITASSLGKMLAQTQTRVKLNDANKLATLRTIILNFSDEAVRAETAFDLDNRLNAQLFKAKAEGLLPDYLKQLKKTLIKNNPRGMARDYPSKVYEILKTNIGSLVDDFWPIKLGCAVRGDTQEISRSYSNLLMNMEPYFRDEYFFIIDAIATGAAFSRLMFAEKVVGSLDQQSEFYRIVRNMNAEFNDIDMVVEKSWPIYEEFYQSDLKYITDKTQYACAIVMMTNSINLQDGLNEKELAILGDIPPRIDNPVALKTDVQRWVTTTAKRFPNLERDIDKYIVMRIMKTADTQSVPLLLSSLGDINSFHRLYSESVIVNRKASDRDRYLRGDFSIEKQQIEIKQDFNNLVTGSDFEEYLENLFNKLGYDVTRCGKTGDQGADLILKMNGIIYAVQAKYYSGKLSNTPVQEVVGALKYYSANIGVVATNNYFTEGAIELAKANKVILLNGDDLRHIVEVDLKNSNNSDILQNYL